MPTSYDSKAEQTGSWTRSTVYQAPADSNGKYPPPDFDSSSSPGTKVEMRSVQKTWVRTPNYRQKRDAGTLPMNEYWHETRARHNAVLSRNKTTDLGGGGYFRESIREDVLLNFPGSGSLPTGPLNNKVLAKARSQKWSLPVFVGEGRQTVELVLSTARRLNRVVKALKRGNLGDAYAVLNLHYSKNDVRSFNRAWGTKPHDAAANLWMEARYGWRPLLGDVRSAAEALAHSVQQPGAGDYTIRASYSDSSSSEGPILSASGASGVGYQYRIISENRTSARAVWRVSRQAGWQPSWIGLDNPFEVLWELTPLSFVADWFLPIGDYLSALSFSYPVSHKEYGVALKVENSFVYNHVMTDPSTSFSGGKTTYVAKRFVPQGGPPSASLFVSPKINFDWAKAVDSLVLLRQNLRSLGRG